jgi:glycosyltransferase involved in cell wall biosynthesis
VYDLATSFSSKGVDCIVSYGGNGKLHDKLIEAGIKTIPIKSLTRDVSLFREFSVIRETFAILLREKPDVVHLNSSKAAGVGALVARLVGVKHIIVTMHGAPFREDRRYFSKKLIYFFTWLTCLLAHTIITVSKHDEMDIGAMFFVKKKVKTIYLGITYEPKAERSVPKSRIARIVTVGELTRNKGYIYALKAVEKLKLRGVPFTYSIIGEGEERKKLEKYIESKHLYDVVNMLGYLDAREVLHNYDIYLLPSVKEGLPYILLEAGKTSLPVVATITGGVPEIIRHEETGLLVQPKDHDGLSLMLEKMVYERNYGKKLGQALHSHIMQNFGYSKMLAETAKVYGIINQK